MSPGILLMLRSDADGIEPVVVKALRLYDPGVLFGTCGVAAQFEDRRLVGVLPGEMSMSSLGSCLVPCLFNVRDPFGPSLSRRDRRLEL